MAILVGYGIVIGLAVRLAFQLAEPIAAGARQDRHQRDDTADGLILAALAVEVMADGLRNLFPVLHRAN